jgi:hypothetical protein
LHVGPFDVQGEGPVRGQVAEQDDDRLVVDAVGDPAAA